MQGNVCSGTQPETTRFHIERAAEESLPAVINQSTATLSISSFLLQA